MAGILEELCRCLELNVFNKLENWEKKNKKLEDMLKGLFEHVP